VSVALIGNGYWGSILKRYIQKDRHYNLKYVCNSKSDLNEVWNDIDVKAVVIATRNEQRFSIIEQALLHKKHVLTEKPLALTLKEARYLVSLSKRAKLALVVDYTFTVSQSLIMACKFIKEGRIGKLLGFNMTVNHLAPFGGGSVYWILGSHMLSVLNMFIPLEGLSFAKRDVVVYKGAVETGVIQVDGEVVGQINLSLNYPDKTTEVILYGTGGTIVYNPNKSDSLIIENYERKVWAKGKDLPQKREIIPLDETNNLKYVMEYFYDVMNEKRTGNSDIGVKITEILERLHGNP
jgi:predicted dehydrogenase